MRRCWSSILLAAVIVQIPFEARYELLGLSNLQWTFVALAIVTAPALSRNWKWILRQRLVRAAIVFVSIQWLAALFAPEFHANAVKAAIRFNAGFLLLVITLVTIHKTHLSSAEPGSLVQTAWVIASAVAAVYALLSYVGIGVPWLFRSDEFYVGQVQRLSGSFEYPNTAAAYFAMSLPIVWWSGFRPLLRWSIAFLLWAALILTFSKGALIAVVATIAAGVAVGVSTWLERSSAALLLILGLVAYVFLLPVNPYLVERLYSPGMRNPIAAEYTPAWNKLTQQPGTDDLLPLHIRNAGVTKWRAGGLWRSAVACRWWNIETESFIQTSPVATFLSRDVARGEVVELSAAFRTPEQPGKYLLVVELFTGNYDWFSRTGVIPALVRVDVERGISRSAVNSDLSAFYHRKQMPYVFTASIPRSTLWQAALRMFLQHPFGVGPDNYRLEYGKYVGATRWDTHVYSNNLILELLTGSGILGLAGFVLLLAAIRWRFDPSCLAVAIFLVHGIVDVFLMTTPIYFAFWVVLGNSSRPGAILREQDDVPTVAVYEKL